MRASQQTDMPKDLLRGRRRFQAWRGLKNRGRIPERLWTLAVRLARLHGLSRTATALGVNYYRLKKRAEMAANQGRSRCSAFVELPAPPVVVSKQGFFELDNGAGATLRVRSLPGSDCFLPRREQTCDRIG